MLDGVIGFIFIWLFWLISKGKIGRGDAKLSALISLFLGLWGWLLAIFVASFFGLLFVLIKVRCGKMTVKEGIPFAPFLILGGIASFFLKNYFFEILKT